MEGDDSQNTYVLTETEVNRMVNEEEAQFESRFLRDAGTASSSNKRPQNAGKTQFLLLQKVERP